METIERGGVKFVAREDWLKKGIKHGFTMRFGGVSEGPFESLNLGLRRGDNIEKAKKNISIAAKALGLTYENLTLTYQTHTDNVVLLKKEDIGRGLNRDWDSDGIDAVVTNMRGVPLMCYSADCVPALLCDSKAGVVAAVHGGWRGTAKAIAKKTVKLMINSGCKKENIEAFIGPAAGMCCYEVSREVAEAFLPEYAHFALDKGGGKYMLGLKEITAFQLKSAGLDEGNIVNSGICTICEHESFFSHRASGGKSGLLGGFIEMERTEED